jgi:hypothetical protein
MGTARNLRFKTATLTFREDYLYVTAYPRKGSRMYTFSMILGGRHNQQIESAATVFHTLRTVLAAVEHLTLKRECDESWILDNQTDRTRWRELLRTFSNVKTLRVDRRLVEELSNALQPGEGESPTEVLPELLELSYFAIGDFNSAFTVFNNARQEVGRPVTVVCL